MNNIVLSTLNHTWVIDIDGTIVVHNGHKNGHEQLLDGALEFFNSIPLGDMIIFLTSRTIQEKEKTEKFLAQNGIRFDQIIYDAPMGERILINDNKPSGLKMAHAIAKKRNTSLDIIIDIDAEL